MTPDNPTQAGWPASKIRLYQWKPLDILFDFIALVERASVDNVNEVFTDISAIDGRILNIETRLLDMKKLKSGTEDAFANEENQSVGDFFIIEYGVGSNAIDGRILSGTEDAFTNEENQNVGDFFIVEYGAGNNAADEDATQADSETQRQARMMVIRSPASASAVFPASEPAGDDGGVLTTDNVPSTGSSGYVAISDSDLYPYPLGITDEIAESNAALIERHKASTTSMTLSRASSRTSSTSQLSIPSSSKPSTTRLSLENSGEDDK